MGLEPVQRLLEMCNSQGVRPATELTGVVRHYLLQSDSRTPVGRFLWSGASVGIASLALVVAQAINGRGNNRLHEGSVRFSSHAANG